MFGARGFSIALLPTAMVVLAASSAAGSVGEWVETEHAKVRLVSPWERAPVAQRYQLGLEVELIPRWHIYWINGGDAGYPPELELGDGVDVELAFPAPQRFELPGGLVAFGYEQQVTYPLAVGLGAAPSGDSLSLSGEVDFLVCASECVPYKLPITIEQPLASDSPPVEDAATAAHLASWTARVPIAIEEAPDGIAARLVGRLEPGGTGAVELEISPGPARVGALDLFFEPQEILTLGRPELRIAADGPRLRATLALRDPTEQPPAAVPLAWTLTGLELDGRPLALRGVDDVALVSPADPAAVPPAPRGVARPLGLAALAGLAVLILAFLLRRSRRTPPTPP